MTIKLKVTDENEDWLQAAREEDEKDKKKEASLSRRVFDRFKGSDPPDDAA